MAVSDLGAIESEGRRIIGYGRRQPDRIVPQYPTWTLRDLVVHVAGVHGRTAAVCRTLPQERVPTAELPAGGDAFGWAEEQLEEMLQGLRTADPGMEVWTFVPDKRLAFWSRRMLIETGVHRWDAQGAVEDPEPLLPPVAANGLDEFPDLYLPRLGEVPTIELTAVDLGRTWRFGASEPVASIEGTASNLFLRLMSRPGSPLPLEWERAVDGLGSPADGQAGSDRGMRFVRGLMQPSQEHPAFEGEVATENESRLRLAGMRGHDEVEPTVDVDPGAMSIGSDVRDTRIDDRA